METIDIALIFSTAAGLTEYARRHLKLSGGHLQIFGAVAAVLLFVLVMLPNWVPELAEPVQLILYALTAGSFPGAVGTGFNLAKKVGK